MIFAFALMAAAGIVYYIFCVAENRRRDSVHGRPSIEVDGAHQAEYSQDITDIQNKNFRYTY
jgi:hypothetical protein